MAIAQSKIKAGMTLYSRYRRTMGNTTMKEWAQSSVSVLEILPVPEGVRPKARVRTSTGETTMTLDIMAKRYHAWNMYDANEAILHKSLMLGHIMRVERRKPCVKCKARHAAETCPPKQVAA